MTLAVDPLADTVRAPASPLHVCSCGLAYGREAWGSLHYVGQVDDGVVVRELRNCVVCHSTRAVVLGPSETLGDRVHDVIAELERERARCTGPEAELVEAEIRVLREVRHAS